MTKDIASLIKRNNDTIRMVLDSGAFTAWKKGKPINVDDYCRFIENLEFKPWRYFSLDVIGDPDGSMRNYETMINRGFSPVPIFTRGECVSVLDDLYKTSDVVGVGGLVGTPGNAGFVNGIMKKIGARKVHWLGFTKIEFIKHYKPYMCDSSGWEGGARFGAMNLYMGGGRSVTVKKTDFANQVPQRILDRIKELGFDGHLFKKNSSWAGGRSMNRELCAASAVAKSNEVEKRLGTKLFSAATTGLAVNLLLEQFEKQRQI